MRLYLSGPMFGYPEDNLAAFTETASALRAQGIEVVSPREYGLETMVPHGVLKAGLRKLLDCDHLALMDGWSLNRGCLLEVATALLSGIEIVSVTREAVMRDVVLGMTDVAELILIQDEHHRATATSSAHWGGSEPAR